MAPSTPVPVDHILVRTELVTVGAFRCPVDHPLFRDSGPIGQPCVVFPRTAVTIAHDRGAPFLADATIATLYNEGQRYERQPVSPDGDRCDWFGVAEPALREIASARDASAADAARPVRHQRAPVEPRLYRRQRRFFRALQTGDLVDALAIEETTLTIVGDAIASADIHSAHPRRAHLTARGHSLAADARALVARHFNEPLSLSQLAAHLNCSPFHLCRTFRAATGTTLHAYQTDLRLRAALEAIESGAGLTDVALDAGFSSHSHFTHAFRRAFGVPPSRAFANQGSGVPRFRGSRVPAVPRFVVPVRKTIRRA
jgi:AraC-like DNA-binding protein